MKSFNNGNENDNRRISIKVENGAIYFYFDNIIKQFYERKQYIIENDIYEDEPEKEPNYFYWIDVDQWINNNQHWVDHMERKNWFTSKMQNYINEQTINTPI